MKEHEKLGQKQVSKVTLHFVLGHLTRKQTVRGEWRLPSGGRCAGVSHSGPITPVDFDLEVRHLFVDFVQDAGRSIRRPVPSRVRNCWFASVQWQLTQKSIPFISNHDCTALLPFEAPHFFHSARCQHLQIKHQKKANLKMLVSGRTC